MAVSLLLEQWKFPGIPEERLLKIIKGEIVIMMKQVNYLYL